MQIIRKTKISSDDMYLSIGLSVWAVDYT